MTTETKNLADPEDHIDIHEDIKLDLIMLRDSVHSLRIICFLWATAFMLHVIVEIFR